MEFEAKYSQVYGITLDSPTVKPTLINLVWYHQASKVPQESVGYNLNSYLQRSLKKTMDCGGKHTAYSTYYTGMIRMIYTYGSVALENMSKINQSNQAVK